MTYLKKLTRIIAILVFLATVTACGAQNTATPTTTTTPSPAATDTPPAATSTESPTATPVIDQSPTPPPSTPQTGEATPTSAAANPGAGGSAAADKYQYIGQSVPDSKQYLPSTPIAVTWTIKNVGTTTWTKTYMMRFFGGPTGSGPSTIAFGKDVAPGATLSLTATITTPAGIGDYDTWYKLTNDQLQNFGDLDFKYTVSNEPNNKIKPTATP